MFNDKPCGDCKFYDPIMKGNPKGGHKETARGWCSKHSKYPHTEGPGQRFPEGVARVGEGELAQPKVVQSVEVVHNCKTHSKAALKQSKADLIDSLKGKSGVIT